MNVSFATPADVGEPPPSSTIWRYLPIWKLEDLLTTRMLYMCRADRFSDQFEGTLPRQLTEAMERVAASTQRRGTASGNLEHIVSDRHKYKKFFYVNCWHVREDESLSMWEEYIGEGHGVAIRSTYADLVSSIQPPFQELLQFGLVGYLDYDLETFTSLGPLDPLFHKREKYSDERELRVLLQHFPVEVYSERAREVLATAAERNWTAMVQPPEIDLDFETNDHLRVPVDLSRLIQALVAGPRATEAIRSYVSAAASLFGARAETSRYAP